MRFTTVIAVLLCLTTGVAVAFSSAECLSSERELAANICTEVLKNKPEDKRVYMALGEALDALQRYEEAVAHYQSALQRFPNDKKIQHKLSIATSNLKEKNWIKQRQGETPTTISQKPATASFNSKLESIRCRRMAGQAALEACKKAILSQPSNPLLHIAMGNAHRLLNQLEKATAAYQNALNVDPNNEMARRRMSEIQQQSIAKLKTKRLPKNANQPSPPSAPIAKQGETSASSDDFLYQLQLLTKLRKQKLITETEFKERKQVLLDNQFKVASSQGGDRGVNKAVDKRKKSLARIDFGRYFALVIGNNKYTDLPKLKTAVNDARSLAKLLKNEYEFEVKLLINASRYDVIKALGEYRQELGKRDNLLIYYAGHGVLDTASERGYWLPVDAEKSLKANWISTADITDNLKALQPWHVMVIADSCYSGSLVRSAGIVTSTRQQEVSVVKRLQGKKSRTVLTSGGLEPVVDSGGDKHSVFAQALLDVLQENSSVLEGQRLFTKLRNLVVLNADQTPEYADVRKAGHNGGDFIFVRR